MEIPSKEPSINSNRHDDFQTLAKEAVNNADWKAAAMWYSMALEQHSAQLALINQLQEKLSASLEMQAIYDMVGDSLRNTFNAQVVMISEYDHRTDRVFHHYAIESGQHLYIPGWHTIDSSRSKIVTTGKPLMISGDEILRLLEAEKMHIIPGTNLPKTWLGVPIIFRDQVRGVISLQNLDRENAFTLSDIDLLTTLTHSLSLFLENAGLMADMQKRLAQVAALQETSKAILSTLDLNALLQMIIQHATSLLMAEGGILNLVNWDEQVDEVFACYGTASGNLGLKGSLDQSLSGWVTLHNQPEISNHVSSDPRADYSGMNNSFLKKITNAACAPLVIKENVIGTLIVIDKLGGSADFDQDDLDFLTGFANQAAIAIDNAQLYQKAQHLAVVEERSRLARELHDAVTQTLFSASLIAEAVPSAWENDQKQGRELLQELRGLSRGALAEMRTLLLELRPASLLETQLEELLRQLGEAASGREGIPVNISVEGKAALPSDVHVALYRIAQEAVNNIVKHARASHVNIRLRYIQSSRADDQQKYKQSVRLTIQDDGRGFDVTQTPPHRLGLVIMQERAQSIGAKLSIKSHPGQGTQVNVSWKQGGIHDRS
jgi:signal transduction histidine kinase